MSVEVDWGDDSMYIKQFLIKYREFNSTGWKEVNMSNMQTKGIASVALFALSASALCSSAFVNSSNTLNPLSC